jgi:predicted transcriptional regulator
MQGAKQKRRDHLSIIADILDITKDGVLKTQIMYRANLSFTQLNQYIEFLLEHNLIMQINLEGKDHYMITLKGIDFLQCHRELKRLLKNPDQNKRLAPPPIP